MDHGVWKINNIRAAVGENGGREEEEEGEATRLSILP